MSNVEWRMLELTMQRDFALSEAVDCERDGCPVLAEANFASAMLAERMLNEYRANWFPVGK